MKVVNISYLLFLYFIDTDAPPMINFVMIMEGYEGKRGVVTFHRKRVSYGVEERGFIRTRGDIGAEKVAGKKKVRL